MSQPSFSISVVHRNGDLLSPVTHVDALHCPSCKSINFYTPDATKELNIVKCVDCFETLTICDLFIKAISPF